MKKSARITPEAEKEICETIKRMAYLSKNGKVTMTDIAKEVGFSRPALYKNEAISALYKEINESQNLKQHNSKTIEKLEAELAKAKNKIERLETTLAEYDLKYVRWLYNATNANITIEQLNAPMPESIKTGARKSGKR